MSKDVLYPLRLLHGILHELKVKRDLKLKYLTDYKRKLKKFSKVAFLFLTPEYKNIGDHAISNAEIQFLKSMGIAVVEVTYAEVCDIIKFRALDIFNGYPIFINGGGNMGTLWFSVEQNIRKIIQSNPKSTIICFPNTLFYEHSDAGKQEFENSKIIYNHHCRLYLYAREELSYYVMKNAYKNVDLVPDMVLSLNKSGAQQKRNGCLLCLRNDCEKTRTKTQEQQIRNQAEQLFGNAIRDTDMIAEHNISVAERETALQEKFEEFSKAQLVITDRLHGMIFCAITGTPCIVVDSKSPKVRGCYEWIKHLNYICFVDAPEQIVQTYRSIPDGPHKYDNSDLMPYYDKLADDILEILNWK